MTFEVWGRADEAALAAENFSWEFTGLGNPIGQTNEDKRLKYNRTMIQVFFTFLKIVVLFGGSVPGKRSLKKRLTSTKLWVSKYVLTRNIRFSIYSNNAFIQNDH